MRGLLRILLLPLQVVLGIVIGICRFFCICSVTVLDMLQSMLFILYVMVLNIQLYLLIISI